jgi:hypothetical protein
MFFKIIDKFLSEEDFSEIKSFFIFNKLPWYFNKEDVSIDDNQPLQNKNGFFYHSIYNNWQFEGNYPKQLQNIFLKLNMFAPINIRANLNFRDIDCVASKWHCDYEGLNSKTAIFYLNTNNGKTLLKINKKIIPVDSIENRMLIFNSEIKHMSKYQDDVHKRYLININYIENGNR